MSEIIDRVREAVDILDVIGEYVQLKRVGKSYRGLCPFHVEKTPSFYVDPAKGVYHCFGCGASGNVFTFLMEIEGITFREALQRLAKRVGIDIKEERRERPELRLLKETAEFYHRQLYKPDGEKALYYLRERKIPESIISLFNIGYAPPAGTVSYLKNKGFDHSLFIKTGILTDTGKGFRELLRDRLIFPITDEFGRVVGFGGRSLDSSVEPKYINSPESEFFKKGKILYGFYQGKKEIRDKKSVIIVEGYFDVLAMHLVGIKNVCAPMGTALTEDQTQILGKYAEKVYLLFDGDEAGKRAAMRSVKVAMSKGVFPYVALLPRGEDPASLYQKGKSDVVIDTLRNAKNFADFYLAEASSIEEKVRLTKELLEEIEKIDDPVLKNTYIEVLSSVSGIKELQLRNVLAMFEKKFLKKKSEGFSLEMRLVITSLFDNEIREFLSENIDPQDLDDEDAKSILQEFREGKSSEEILTLHPKRKEIIEYAMKYIDLNERVKKDIKSRIKELKFYKERKKIFTKIFEKTEEKDEIEAYLSHIMDLKKKQFRGD